jgi:hypothetical protein
MKHAQKGKLLVIFDFKNEWCVPLEVKLERIEEVHWIVYKTLL